MTLKFDFTDYCRITKPTDKQVNEWKDYMGGMTSTGRTGLRISMEATHAGLLNRNNRLYIPSRMADGVSTFRIDEKPTKLLKHHNPESDPVGVIRGAMFVPTVPNELTNNPDVINLMSSSTPIKTQIKSLRNLWRTGLFQEEGWRGLGYINLIGDVTDKETIEQIKDGRFDAVSTNFNPRGRVHCLLCAQNWVKDGFCEHDYGEMYEDELEDGIKFPAIAIPGNHDYLETSFVSFEGDSLATVRILDEVNINNNKTFFLPDNWKEEITNFNKPTFEFKDFKEDDMAKPEKKVVLSDAEQKVFDIVKELRVDMEDKIITEYSQKITVLQNEDGLFPHQEEAGLDTKTAVQYALEDLETADQKVDVKAVYAMFEEILDEFKLSDTKLDEKALNGLPDSAFCGPERSFPVPDKAHATTAQHVIGRYKGPGNKAEILATINRKAKSLGADSDNSQVSNNDDSSQDINLVSIIDVTEETLKEIKDEDLHNLYKIIEVALIKRGQKMAFECKECAVQEEKVKVAATEVTEAKAEVTKMQDTLTILREELMRSYADYATQVDTTVEALASLHAEKVEKLALIGVLNKKYDTLDNAKEELKDKVLEKMETAITDGFDLTAVTTKLNDGMAQEPTGEVVKDPTVNPDGDNIQLSVGLTAPALGAIENIKDFIKEGNISKAKHIYATMKSLKLFPDELTFESLSVENPLSN